MRALLRRYLLEIFLWQAVVVCGLHVLGGLVGTRSNVEGVGELRAEKV